MKSKRSEPFTRCACGREHPRPTARQVLIHWIMFPLVWPEMVARSIGQIRGRSKSWHDTWVLVGVVLSMVWVLWLVDVFVGVDNMYRYAISAPDETTAGPMR